MALDITTLSEGIQSAKAAFDIAKSLIGIHDVGVITKKSSELTGIIIDVQGKMLEAQQSMAALNEELRQVSQENVKLKEWGAEKEKYVLKNLGYGTFVYELRQEFIDANNPKHWLCTECYSNNKKSIMQKKTTRERGVGSGCPCCNLQIENLMREV